jgi:hypothetical protein
MWMEDSQSLFITKVKERINKAEHLTFINEQTLVTHMGKFRTSIIRFYRELIVFDSDQKLSQIHSVRTLKSLIFFSIFSNIFFTKQNPKNQSLKSRYSLYNQFLSSDSKGAPIFFLNCESDLIQIIDLIFPQEIYPLDDKILQSDFFWNDLMVIKS